MATCQTIFACKLITSYLHTHSSTVVSKMDNVGGNNNGGGFHGYRRFPPPTPANTEMSMGLSAHLNQAIAAAAANTNNNTTNNTEDSECTVREQDRFMPIANVIRIMRRILPSHAKISDDAKETIQECVSEFISFITGEANERCQREQRKTITAEDVLWAMSKLGFDDYIEPLTLYLHRYREFDGGERGSLRGEPLLMKRAMVDPATGNMTMAPYPPPFAMAHHHGYFAYPPPMSNGYMHRDVSNGSTSQGAAATIVENVDSLAEDGKE